MEEFSDFQCFQYVASAFDAPAFVRRGLEVESAWETLLSTCQQKRLTLLELPRLRLAQFFSVAKDWPQIPDYFCRHQDLEYLEELRREWSPRLRIEIRPAKTEQEIQQAFIEVAKTFNRFNSRWIEYLRRINLNTINELRTGYNENYLVEKECATWSTETAHQGFIRLPLVSVETLLERFPLLIVPGGETFSA